jgi:hypothetical protein
MIRAAAIALLLILSGMRAAQADAPIPRLEVKVGDRWIYHHWDQRSIATLA